MINLAVCRVGLTLIPVAELDRLALRDFHENTALSITINSKPPLKVIRYYRALCHMIAQGMGMPGGDSIHNLFMMRAYRVKSLSLNGDGNVENLKVESTKDWCLPEWLIYLDHCREILGRELLPGVPQGPIRREVERLSGVSLDEAMKEPA